MINLIKNLKIIVLMRICSPNLIEFTKMGFQLIDPLLRRTLKNSGAFGRIC